MGTREPGWWYDAGSVMPRLLAPIAAVYGALSARRMGREPRYRASIPVICVGNFTAGGTGKTPCVALIVDLLRSQGHLPVVLTRGYGGSLHGPHWVDAEKDTAAAVGDEPLLLAALAPVMVARDRAAGAKAIESAGGDRPRATVIVMDDGIQNPALAKSLTIAVVDAARGVGNGCCIPAGPLRAPLDGQLRQVDAILLNRGNGDAEIALSAIRLGAEFNGPVLAASVAPAGDLGWLAGAPVVAFAGIGVPERFFATVAAAGGILRQTVAYPDHHMFSADDARHLISVATVETARLVTTEKDRARLAGLAPGGALAELASACRALPIRLVLDAPSAAKLGDLVATRAPIRR